MAGGKAVRIPLSSAGLRRTDLSTLRWTNFNLSRWTSVQRFNVKELSRELEQLLLKAMKL